MKRIVIVIAAVLALVAGSAQAANAKPMVGGSHVTAMPMVGGS